MNKFAPFVLVSLLFCSAVCDSFYNCNIYNNSQDTIVFQETFRKDLLDKTYYSRNYTRLLAYEIEKHGGILAIQIDTNNLSIKYKVPPQAKFTLTENSHFENYKTLVFIKRDTVVLKGEVEIEKAFEKVDEGYLLTIQ